MAKEDILRSWKDISSYLSVNAKTCRRWEVEHGLPIHRIHAGSDRSPVFAYISELESWLAAKPVLSAVGPAARAPAPGRKKLAAWGIGGLGSALLAAAFLSVSPHSPFKALSGDLSIAVFPFENLNRTPQDQYFSEGITHEIINDLASYDRVRVFPTLETAGAGLPPGRIDPAPSSLRADYLLRGGIRRESGVVHLDIEIMRVRDHTRVLSLRLDESLDKPFNVINSVCRRVSETLRLSRDPIQESAMTVARTKSAALPAFDSYLKGNYVLNRYGTRQDTDPWQLYTQGKYYWGQFSKAGNDLAIQLFNEALSLDSTFAQAYIGLAYCYGNFVNYGWDFQEVWLDKAEELLQKAQSLVPDLPEYFSCRIEISLMKYVAFGAKTREIAYALAEQGIRQYPTYPLINSIAGYCYFMKFGETGGEEEFQKALEYKRRSFAGNPYSFGNLVYAELLMLNRDFANALSVLEIIRNYDPDKMALARMGEIYYYMGELEKSRTIMEDLNTPPLAGKISALYFLAMIAAREGDIPKARAIRAEINTLSPRHVISQEHLLMNASIDLGIGEKSSGYRNLDLFFTGEKARKMPHVYMRYIDIDRNFDRYRGEAEFQRILQKGIRPWLEAKPSESLQISKNVLMN